MKTSDAHIERAAPGSYSSRARPVPEDPRAGTHQLLATRRNISPRRLVEPGPGADELSCLMEAAVTAPDHGLLTPWHFILIPTVSRPTLGDAFARALIERDPGATQAQIEAAREKADRAPCLLLAVAHLDAEPNGISHTERLISLGCAIQNILLSATSMGYGSGLTSGRSLQAAAVRDLFSLKSHEQAVCFIAVGTTDQPKPARERPDAGSVFRTLSV
ncbi:nitroreductase [Variovorax sp. ZS18.2.2]|uniref:nitroreductase family protein n=1 Tax=Variovorax sp. ZS18.2.2 TaxID=2971255 RepID=UPI002151CBE6|nr:nitroreductase [Variovorax sp. ZS18.2.2]MCR6478078.1 nitroreductase [Variovorax sp. ZS18.2.2]